MIVVQPTRYSPLEHYNTLGYIMVVMAVLNIFMLYRVKKLVGNAEVPKAGDIQVVEGI